MGGGGLVLPRAAFAALGGAHAGDDDYFAFGAHELLLKKTGVRSERSYVRGEKGEFTPPRAAQAKRRSICGCRRSALDVGQ